MIAEIINYVVTHPVEIFTVVTSVIGTASVIARLTPTQRDDRIIEKIRKFVEKIGTAFLPDLQVKGQRRKK